jgi:peptidoglycan hydrolase-like protein with peptidoglycan-binding domain
MALKRVSIPSPNYSSRGGSKVRLIVLHTSEGATTYQSLGSFFGNPSSQVSSHVGIDNTSGIIGEYVARGNKAWTSANANPVAVQAELCTPSGAAMGWSAAQWQQQTNMLANTAAWIAEEAAALGIPIVKLSPAQAQSNGAGVCQHSDLGSWGGGHTDCGPNFPIDHVISMAGGVKPSPSPTPPAPAFPYPASDYLGQPSPDPHCHSGYYGGVDSLNVQKWQTQMVARGWSLTVDGAFGPQSSSVCRQFQQEKGLGVDGLVGPQTWGASWTAPVT